MSPKWRGLLQTIPIAVLVLAASAFQALPQAQSSGRAGALPPIEVRDPGPTGRRVATADVFGNYFPARGQGRGGAILLIGGSEGGLGRGPQHMALDLQARGFNVLHVAYFGAPGLAPELRLIPLERFDKALDWLAAQPGVDPARLAVVGASKGAEAALMVATRRPDLKAVVAGMPSSALWPAIASDWGKGGQPTDPSWSAEGRPLPRIPYGAWSGSILSVYRDGLLQGASAHADAFIPVEKATAPILLVCGEAETMWPACPMARDVKARADRAGGPQVDVRAYKDAGHLVFGPPLRKDDPFYPRLGLFGGSPEGNNAARRHSWAATIAFLTTHLAPPESQSGESQSGAQPVQTRENPPPPPRPIAQ